MIKNRNLAAHSYDEERAQDIINAIIDAYYSQFNKFAEKMTSLEEQ